MKTCQHWTAISSWCATETKLMIIGLASERLICRLLSRDSIVYKSNFNWLTILHNYIPLFSVDNFLVSCLVLFYFIILLTCCYNTLFFFTSVITFMKKLCESLWSSIRRIWWGASPLVITEIVISTGNFLLIYLVRTFSKYSHINCWQVNWLLLVMVLWIYS